MSNLTKLTESVDIIQGLSDRPNALDGLDAAQLKAKYDEAANIIKLYINNVLIPEIESIDAGIVTKSDLTNARKLSPSGNFTGSWFGITNPVLADPGIANVVVQHTEQLAENALLALNSNSTLSNVINEMATGASVKVVCYGDSVTWGYKAGSGTQVTNPYPAALQVRLRDIYSNNNITVMNKGHSGWQSVEGLANIETEVIIENPNIVIIMFGINDVRGVSGGKTPISEYKENLKNMLEICIKNGIEVLLLSPTPINETASDNHKILKDFALATKEAAESYKKAFVDMHKEITKMYLTNAIAPYDFMGDSVHPADNSYRYIADIVLKELLDPNSMTKVLDVNGSKKYSMPLVYSPFVTHNLSNTFISDLQEYKINYIMSVGSSGQYLKFNFFVTEPNMKLILKHAKNSVGGQLNVRDNGVIIKLVDFYAPASHVVNAETTLIENLSIGWHSILFDQADLTLGQSATTGTSYLGEVIIKPNETKRDITYVNASGNTYPQLENFQGISKGGTLRIKGTVASEQRGAILFSGPSAELKVGEKLVIEAEGTFTTSTGISWFGNQMSASSGTNVSGVNTGYLIFLTSTQIQLFYFGNLNALSAAIATTAFSLDYNVPHKIRVEHAESGEIVVYIDGVERIRVTDKRNKNGYFGLWSFGASTMTLDRYEFCYT